MALPQPELETHLTGVQYVTDESGRRTAVIISLEQWGDLWEDLYDVMVAESRANEPRLQWKDVKASLNIDDDLPD
jgi:hypothetical protein